MSESMKPYGNMFHFFRAEQNRLEKELRDGTIERIFYTDKQSSIQYTISNQTDSTQNGTLTVLLHKDKNTFLWCTETDKNSYGCLGICIGTIVARTENGHMELCLIREDAMDTVPPIVTRLVNDYHTKRSQMRMKLKEADSYCIENHVSEEN